jgi:hypothetical protein
LPANVCPEASSMTTTSVKVPPISTATLYMDSPEKEFQYF